MSEGTFRRCRDGYGEEGEAGLLDRRLGKASSRRRRRYRERYLGFNVMHFHEHLVKAATPVPRPP